MADQATASRFTIDATDPLKGLTLNGEKLSARVAGMVTAASLERTMEGPSTLRLSLFDPDYWLTRVSGIIGTRGFRTTCEWQGRRFTLAQLDKTEDGFDLEFVVTAAAVLSRSKPRTKKDWHKASRGRLTRARAVNTVCSRLHVAFADWEGVDERQPIQSFTRDEQQTLDDAKASQRAQAKTRSRIARGALNGKNITIKGVSATGQQRRALRDALSVAEVHGLPVKPTLAMLVAGIAEGQFVPDRPNQAGSGAVGPWQIMSATASTLGIDPTDVQAGATAFLVGIRVQGRLQSFTGLPGAIQLSKQRPELSAPELANLLEGGGVGPGFYAAWMDEANKILRAWSPGDDEQSADDITPLTGTPDRARRGRYEFRVNPGESYFEAIVRWAEEVNWRFFIIDTPEHRDGMVWFIDDLTLARAAPSAVIAEGDPGVDRILWSRTRRGRIDSCTIQGQAQFWDYTPGQCIVVNGENDPADGRWLIRSIEHDLLDDAHMVEVTLGKAQAPKPEPKPSIVQSAGTDPDVDPDTKVGKSAQVAKAYAKAVEIDKRNYPYPYGGGHGRSGQPSADIRGNGNFGYDCSGFVSAVLHAANLGVGDSPLDTTRLGQWGKPGRGKYLTVWVKPYLGMSGHTFLVFEDAFTDNGQEFFEAGGTSGALTGRRPGGRSTAGFEPRHYPGL